MLYVDPRAGSKLLEPYLKELGMPVECKRQIDADFEFLGYGPDGPMSVGGEYKRLSDCLTSMTDGRLTGTQLPRMRACYDRIYLIVEGAVRRNKHGVLETSMRGGGWQPVYGRGGEGWTAREFWGRLESIAEFFGCRILQTYDIYETAARIAVLYKYWSKPYEEHSSYAQWDQSRGNGPKGAVLLPTAQLPLVQRWAREIDGIGADKSMYVAQHFKSAFNLALADAAEWRKVSWLEKLKKGGYRRKRISKEQAEKIVAAVQEVK